MRRGLVGVRTVSAGVGPWLSPAGVFAALTDEAQLVQGEVRRALRVRAVRVQFAGRLAGHCPHGRAGNPEPRRCPSATAPDSILEVAFTLISWLTF